MKRIKARAQREITVIEQATITLLVPDFLSSETQVVVMREYLTSLNTSELAWTRESYADVEHPAPTILSVRDE